ncbi:unnamed protein product [Vitrella brassicaformis CCMP3155]|uniref:Uncharacterized protein n=3 Tax=Vitrella brassicaformis TaxID=1169539 RepID=A0A0G4F3U8_VITBC|nr:unnamed protein product [Vitrella brassicaformis CCMP3155]|eukprot:CEM06898.1 unnamed protein product [Vitrella brassicaformis CCMP3155]
MAQRPPAEPNGGGSGQMKRPRDTSADGGLYESDIRGVSFNKKANAWMVAWQEGGRRRSKCFSVRNADVEVRKQEALEYLLEQRSRLGMSPSLERKEPRPPRKKSKKTKATKSGRSESLPALPAPPRPGPRTASPSPPSPPPIDSSIPASLLPFRVLRSRRSPADVQEKPASHDVAAVAVEREPPPPPPPPPPPATINTDSGQPPRPNKGLSSAPPPRKQRTGKKGKGSRGRRASKGKKAGQRKPALSVNPSSAAAAQQPAVRRSLLRALYPRNVVTHRPLPPPPMPLSMSIDRFMSFTTLPAPAHDSPKAKDGSEQPHSSSLEQRISACFDADDGEGGGELSPSSKKGGLLQVCSTASNGSQEDDGTSSDYDDRRGLSVVPGGDVVGKKEPVFDRITLRFATRKPDDDDTPALLAPPPSPAPRKRFIDLDNATPLLAQIMSGSLLDGEAPASPASSTYWFDKEREVTPGGDGDGDADEAGHQQQQLAFPSLMWPESLLIDDSDEDSPMADERSGEGDGGSCDTPASPQSCPFGSLGVGVGAGAGLSGGEGGDGGSLIPARLEALADSFIGPYDEELIGRIMSEDIDNDASPSPLLPPHHPSPPPSGQQQPEVTSPQPPSLPFSLQSTPSSRHSDDAHSDSRRPRYTLTNAAPIPMPSLPLIRRFDIHPQMAGSHQSAEVTEMGAAVHTSGVMMGLTAASCGSASARGVTSMMGVM